MIHIKRYSTEPINQPQIKQSFGYISNLPSIYKNLNFLPSNQISPFIASQLASSKSNRKSIDHYIFDEIYDRKNMKKLLYEQYQQQIKIKKQKDFLQKTKQKQLQTQILMHNEELQEKIRWYNLQNKLVIRKQLQNNYKQNQQHKKSTKIYEQQEKQKQRQILKNKKFLNKKALFEQYYLNCQKGMRRNSMNYIKNVIPQDQIRQIQKDRLIEAGINRISEKYNNLNGIYRSENRKKTQQLKTQLLSQKQQKQEFKRYNSQKKLSQIRRIDSSYHNPIVNPVNFGINPQNKYVIGEIKKSLNNRNSQNIKRQNHELNVGLFPQKRNFKQLSNLARNGQHVLL